MPKDGASIQRTIAAPSHVKVPLSPDKANQKHRDDCADNRHDKSSGMKGRALSGPGEQPGEQSTHDRPNDANKVVPMKPM
jgi:hypothetical protein